MVFLWLDDIRNPFIDLEGKVPTLDRGWEVVWVRSYDEFSKWITDNGLPDFISFDHDLADEHYVREELWDDYEASKRHQDSQTYKEKTGKDCANWLVEYCLDNSYPLPGYAAHSANPPGADNILKLLNQYSTVTHG